MRSSSNDEFCNISAKIDSSWNVLLEHFGTVCCLLPWGVGVKMYSHVLDFFFQLPKTASFGSFENHMLEEVRSTICRISFKATSSINPHTNCGGICWKIGLCRHAQTVRQCCQFQFWCAKDGCVIDSARYRQVLALESLVRHGQGMAMPDRSYCCYSLPCISCPSQNTTHYHPAKPCTIFSGSISHASPRLILSQMENHLKDISKDDWKFTVSTQSQLCV